MELSRIGFTEEQQQILNEANEKYAKEWAEKQEEKVEDEKRSISTSPLSILFFNGGPL